jgi:hypothetical protein
MIYGLLLLAVIYWVGGWLSSRRGLKGADRVAADCRLETGRHKTPLKEQGVRHGDDPNGRPAVTASCQLVNFQLDFDLNCLNF